MKVMLKVFVFVFISFGVVKAQGSFPESWVGKYQGDLMIYDVDSVRMKVDMKLEILKTAKDSIFDWTLIYDLDGKKDVRAYSLKVVDHQKGHYRIDERNSIIIEGYLHNNNVFTSFFNVSNTYIIATYTKKEDSLFFEIIAGDGEAVTITGKTKKGEEEIPEVISYLVNGRQKAVLNKVE